MAVRVAAVVTVVGRRRVWAVGAVMPAPVATAATVRPVLPAPLWVSLARPVVRAVTPVAAAPVVRVVLRVAARLARGLTVTVVTVEVLVVPVMELMAVPGTPAWLLVAPINRARVVRSVVPAVMVAMARTGLIRSLPVAVVARGVSGVRRRPVVVVSAGTAAPEVPV